MSSFPDTLFQQLNSLVFGTYGEAFYAQDFVRDGSTYRIYNYRLASYSHFLLPSALECRGIMFHISRSGQTDIRLVSLPPRKFFNLNENPFTMNLDLSDVKRVEVKADGSIISTFPHVNHLDQYVLGLKSRGSIQSEQVKAAEAFLQQPENAAFAHQLFELTMAGYTVSMEWCAPDNRVVLPYFVPQLKVLCIRDNMNGSYIDKNFPNWSPDYCDQILDRWIEEIDVGGKPEEYIASVPDMQGVEGIVFTLGSGQQVKVKTKWYLALHHTKDSVNSDRRLYEVVLSQGSDDLRALFHDDQLVLDRIDKMEAFVQEKYNKLAARVDSFFTTNRHLNRKEYAVLGQQTLDVHAFRLAMERYIGREASIKEYMLSRWKEFGIKDEPQVNTTIE